MAGGRRGRGCHSQDSTAFVKRAGGRGSGTVGEAALILERVLCQSQVSSFMVFLVFLLKRFLLQLGRGCLAFGVMVVLRGLKGRVWVIFIRYTVGSASQGRFQ